MSLSFRQFRQTEREQLADWLSSDKWPFHGQPVMTREAVLYGVDQGLYDSQENQTWWVISDGREIGLVRLFELGDPTPRFDLRLRTDFRGKGIGQGVLRWLTGQVFAGQPGAMRLEGQTRQDNFVMRRVFALCGYVKEAHYRQAWPTPDGEYLDAIGYAMLRSDWENQTQTQVDWGDGR